MAFAVSLDDEEEKRRHTRCLFVSGGPASGKSAALLEVAVRSARGALRVLIVCPAGQLVHSFKSQLPDVDGIENIQVDTIHGVLGYKRKGADEKVQWAPPSALRRIDVILVDEASQYDKQEWKRLAQAVAEQPHLPYLETVPDFQQLQPVISGGLCENMVTSWPRSRSTPCIGFPMNSSCSSSTESGGGSPLGRHLLTTNNKMQLMALVLM